MPRLPETGVEYYERLSKAESGATVVDRPDGTFDVFGQEKTVGFVRLKRNGKAIKKGDRKIINGLLRLLGIVIGLMTLYGLFLMH